MKQTDKIIDNDSHSAEPVPRWLQPVLYSQMALGVLLVVAGIGHIAAQGYLANIGTGIYAGLAEIITSGLQLWILKKNNDVSSSSFLYLCKFSIAFSLILCAVNVPLISILSIIMGDAFGYPHRSCRYFGPISDFSCITVTQAPNVGALLCDVVLLLAGFGSGGLLAKSGIYFLPLRKNTVQIFDTII